jgi:hypothetical protein
VKYIDVVTGQYLEDGYGKCDRVDSCGYHKIPPALYVQENEERIVIEEEKSLWDSDNFTKEYYETFRKNEKKIPNTFMRGITDLFGKDAAITAYNKYKLGTFYDGHVIFPYYFNGELKTGKIIPYKKDLHRDKNKSPMWLHSWGNDNTYKKADGNVITNGIDERTFKFALPLFGWDIIKDNQEKTICLVEAEKTAVIASIVFPEYNWLATGGLYGLQRYKFNFYSGRKWYIFPDLGYMKYKGNDTKVSNYWKMRISDINGEFTIIDEYPYYLPLGYSEEQIKMAETMQLDLADFLLMKNNDGYIKDLKEILNNNVY